MTNFLFYMERYQVTDGTPTDDIVVDLSTPVSDILLYAPNAVDLTDDWVVTYTGTPKEGMQLNVHIAGAISGGAGSITVFGYDVTDLLDTNAGVITIALKYLNGAWDKSAALGVMKANLQGTWWSFDANDPGNSSECASPHKYHVHMNTSTGEIFERSGPLTSSVWTSVYQMPTTSSFYNGTVLYRGTGTYIMPGGTLNTDGDGIEVRYEFRTNLGTYNVYFWIGTQFSTQGWSHMCGGAPSLPYGVFGVQHTKLVRTSATNARIYRSIELCDNPGTSPGLAVSDKIIYPAPWYIQPVFANDLWISSEMMFQSGMNNGVPMEMEVRLIKIII